MAKSSVKDTVDQEQNEQQESGTAVVTMSMMDIQTMVNNMVDARMKEAEASSKGVTSEDTDEEVKKVNESMKELVAIELFLDNDKYKDDVIVSVNGKTWQIKRGVEVQVPRYVAEVIKNSQKQDRATAMRIRELEQESAEKLKNM
jgi:hypothetical protein